MFSCIGFVFGRGLVMAVRLDVHLDDYEYRGFRDGQGEKERQ